MKANGWRGLGAVAVAWVLGTGALAGNMLVADFEGLSVEAGWVAAYAGPGGGAYYNGANGSGGFSSGGVDFGNSYTDWGGGYYSWTGWGYSTTTDTQTAGYGNQYSAFAGAAASGTVYAVTYAPSVIDLPAGWRAPVSLAVTNTSYAGISMRDGDDFAKQFGAGDWFKLVLTGRDADGAVLGAVEVYLADFRGGLETGYIVDSWLTVDLSPLGTDVAQIGFALESTDNGAWGMNTPAYLAVDDLVLGATAVPEPGAIATVFGLLALGWVAYRRRP